MDNLLKRSWTGLNGCVMCGSELETVDHLLVECVVSKFRHVRVSSSFGKI